MKTHLIQKPRLTLFASALLAFALLVRLAANAAPLGTTFTYQGLLTENANPINGSYDLLFNLYSTEIGGSPVTASQVKPGVPVVNGLFTTNVDFGAVYDGTAYWLEIGARPNGSAANFQIMTPRQELTLSPYTIFATTAGGVAGGAVRSLNGLSDSVTLAGVNGVSITTVGNSLQISGSGSGGFALPFTGSVASPDPLFRINNTGNGTAIYGNSPGGTGVYGETVSSTGFGVFGYNGSTGIGVHGLCARGDGVYGFGKNGVHGESSSASDSGVFGKNTGSGYGVFGFSSSGKGVYGFSFTGGASSAAVWGENIAPGGMAVVGKSSGLASKGVYGESAAADGVGVYGANTSGGEAGHFQGSVGVTGNIFLRADVDHNQGLAYDADIDGPFLFGYNRGALGTVVPKNQALTWDWHGNVSVAQNLSTCSLTIRGGCDLAEPFQMSTESIARGSVVVIDDQNAGQLKISDRAYDTRVAGIVSGANGINPGIALHQEGALEGGQNVALSGRVYVLADASSSQIRPGDLLTTSDTPGCAMKVTDYAKAQGAILGKAMSALKEGKGMVLVLVSLQ